MAKQWKITFILSSLSQIVIHLLPLVLMIQFGHADLTKMTDGLTHINQCVHGTCSHTLSHTQKYTV